ARCGPSQPTRRAAKGPSRQLWAERHTSDKARNPGHSVYDVWNRLVKVVSGSTTVVYSYDVLGRRITTTAGFTTTNLYYSSNWQVLEEDSSSGTPQAQYVWSPMYADSLVERDLPLTNQRLYVQQDANWNVTAITQSGSVQERYVYDPYGKPSFYDSSWNARVSSAFSWLYLQQGGRYDTTSGLYNFRNRDYSPTLGRWLQEDPIGYNAGSRNLYGYEGEDPTNKADPSGLAEEKKPVPPKPVDPGSIEAGDSTRIDNKQNRVDPIQNVAVIYLLDYLLPAFSVPFADPGRGPGKVYTIQRGTYTDCPFGLPESPTPLPHGVIVVEYSDGTFTTYSFGPNGWETDSEKDRNAWGFVRVDVPGLTGDDIRQTIRERKRKGSIYDFFTLSGDNCQSALRGVIYETLEKKTGKPDPRSLGLTSGEWNGVLNSIN
ncbi:MAG TPA: RHS repeat-associated core domain-containing protein, partial [Gemmataceae bacterium]|nr:RHS repeat-associated core domain-containing protein [Gemmataceae bacterium]